MKQRTAMKVLFAGGGTAGHVEPALAVARAWSKKYPADEIVFLGTEVGLENSLVPTSGFKLLHIPKVTISRRPSLSLALVPIQLLKSIISTSRHLSGVDLAIGFGGYVSAPLYLAARMRKVPYVIHEQNAKPGWANRLGAWLTRYVALSYYVKSPQFRGCEITGLPLRRDVTEALLTAEVDWSQARRKAKERIAKKYDLNPELPLIFIFGGSQGSQVINQVIAQSKALTHSQELAVIHGIGKKNLLPEPGPYYRPLPYIEDMADCYLAADLLISRSGAVTCAEATALSRYSLFIPLPIGNGEQALNAQSLIEAERAELIEQASFTSQWLEANITRLLALASTRPLVGDNSGITAVDKIVAMMERALNQR